MIRSRDPRPMHGRGPRGVPIARLVLVALAMLAPPALAAPGPHLSWDHCWADGQVANKSFACDTNAGTDYLYASYESPVTTAADRVGVEMTFFLTSADGVYPAWWEVAGATQCRASALTTAAVGDPNSACTDPYRGVGASGAALSLGTQGPGTARLRAAAAVPQGYEFALQAGTEYFAVRMAISHAKTTGTGSCGGCATPVCIGAGVFSATEATGTNPVQMLGSAPPGGGDPTVSWQGAYTRSFAVVFERTGYYVDLQCDATGPVPTRRTTWGSLKAVYR